MTSTTVVKEGSFLKFERLFVADGEITCRCVGFEFGHILIYVVQQKSSSVVSFHLVDLGKVTPATKVPSPATLIFDWDSAGSVVYQASVSPSCFGGKLVLVWSTFRDPSRDNFHEHFLVQAAQPGQPIPKVSASKLDYLVPRGHVVSGIGSDPIFMYSVVSTHPKDTPSALGRPFAVVRENRNVAAFLYVQVSSAQKDQSSIKVRVLRVNTLHQKSGGDGKDHPAVTKTVLPEREVQGARWWCWDSLRSTLWVLCLRVGPGDVLSEAILLSLCLTDGKVVTDKLRTIVLYKAASASGAAAAATSGASSSSGGFGSGSMSSTAFHAESPSASSGIVGSPLYPKGPFSGQLVRGVSFGVVPSASLGSRSYLNVAPPRHGSQSALRSDDRLMSHFESVLSPSGSEPNASQYLNSPDYVSAPHLPNTEPNFPSRLGAATGNNRLSGDSIGTAQTTDPSASQAAAASMLAVAQKPLQVQVSRRCPWLAGPSAPVDHVNASMHVLNTADNQYSCRPANLNGFIFTFQSLHFDLPPSVLTAHVFVYLSSSDGVDNHVAHKREPSANGQWHTVTVPIDQGTLFGFSHRKSWFASHHDFRISSFVIPNTGVFVLWIPGLFMRLYDFGCCAPALVPLASFATSPCLDALLQPVGACLQSNLDGVARAPTTGAYFSTRSRMSLTPRMVPLTLSIPSPSRSSTGYSFSVGTALFDARVASFRHSTVHVPPTLFQVSLAASDFVRELFREGMSVIAPTALSPLCHLIGFHCYAAEEEEISDRGNIPALVTAPTRLQVDLIGNAIQTYISSLLNSPIPSCAGQNTAHYSDAEITKVLPCLFARYFVMALCDKIRENRGQDALELFLSIIWATHPEIIGPDLHLRPGNGPVFASSTGEMHCNMCVLQRPIPRNRAASAASAKGSNLRAVSPRARSQTISSAIAMGTRSAASLNLTSSRESLPRPSRLVSASSVSLPRALPDSKDRDSTVIPARMESSTSRRDSVFQSLRHRLGPRIGLSKASESTSSMLAVPKHLQPVVSRIEIICTSLNLSGDAGSVAHVAGGPSVQEKIALAKEILGNYSNVVEDLVSIINAPFEPKSLLEHVQYPLSSFTPDSSRVVPTLGSCAFDTISVQRSASGVTPGASPLNSPKMSPRLMLSYTHDDANCLVVSPILPNPCASEELSAHEVGQDDSVDGEHREVGDDASSFGGSQPGSSRSSVDPAPLADQYGLRAAIAERRGRREGRRNVRQLKLAIYSSLSIALKVLGLPLESSTVANVTKGTMEVFGPQIPPHALAALVARGLLPTSHIDPAFVSRTPRYGAESPKQPPADNSLTANISSRSLSFDIAKLLDQDTSQAGRKMSLLGDDLVRSLHASVCLEGQRGRLGDVLCVGLGASAVLPLAENILSARHYVTGVCPSAPVLTVDGQDSDYSEDPVEAALRAFTTAYLSRFHQHPAPSISPPSPSKAAGMPLSPIERNAGDFSSSLSGSGAFQTILPGSTASVASLLASSTQEKHTTVQTYETSLQAISEVAAALFRSSGSV